jgi:Protein of unknown function (DUF1573)
MVNIFQLILCTLVALNAAASLFAAEKTIAVKDAIKIIQHWENKVERLEWKAEQQSGSLKVVTDRHNVTFAPNYTKSVVVCEPATHKIRVEEEGVFQWLEGPIPLVGQRAGMSYNGEARREYKWAGEDKDIPHPGTGFSLGIVDSSNSWETGTTNWMVASGAYCFPPYLFGQKLSTMLESSQAKRSHLVITEGEDGVWTIVTSDVFPVPGRFIRVRYDPARGVVTGVTWAQGDARGKPFKEMYISLVRTDNGFWVPNRIETVNVLDKTIDRITYTGMKVNQPNQGESFTLTFPLKTKVEDHIEKSRYIVGKGVADDEAAILEYAHLHGLRMDEDPSDLGNSQSRSIFRRVGLGVGSLLALVLLFLFWRRRKHKAVVAGVFFLSLGASGGGALPAAEVNDRGEWVVGRARGEEIRISQCGLNVTVFALHCAGKNYQLGAVARSMPVTWQGIRFSDIQTVLEAHGLKCAARRDVSLREVQDALRPGMLAIFPVDRPNGPNHYLMAVNHPKKGCLLLDVPARPPIPIEDVLDDSSVQPLQGLVLFVGNKRDNPPQAKSVELSPLMTDLGSFVINDVSTATPTQIKVTLRSDADGPLMVSRVSSSCGCVNPQWKGGVLLPGERKEITFQVLRGAWGVGQTEKELRFEFHDGSASVFVVKGEGRKDAIPGKLVLSPSRLQINLDQVVRGNPIITRTVQVTLEEDFQGLPVKVIPKVDWIRSRWQNDDANSGVLVFQIDAAKFTSGEEGEVLIVPGDKQKGAVILKVVGYSEPVWQVTPDPVRVSLRGSRTGKAVIVPRKGDQRTLKSHRLITVPNGFEVVTSQPASTVLSLNVNVRGGRPGAHLVEVGIRDDREKESRISVLILVEE